MKVVVADTGVIISLIHIGQLDLIEKILLKAKQKGLINELRPLFEKMLMAGRYFSL